MSTLNIGFYEEISKMISNCHQLSSNRHCICSSAGNYPLYMVYWSCSYENGQ